VLVIRWSSWWSGFPKGSEVTYTDAMGMVVRTVGSGGLPFILMEATKLELQSILGTLRVKPPLNSGMDFNLNVTVIDSSMAGNNRGSYLHFVNVSAVVDTPSVNATDVITLNEGASVPMVINPGSDNDNLDHSEFLSRFPSTWD
jgi:hypothetical protein